MANNIIQSVQKVQLGTVFHKSTHYIKTATQILYSIIIIV